MTGTRQVYAQNSVGGGGDAVTVVGPWGKCAMAEMDLVA